jgi:hypothetical protein
MATSGCETSRTCTKKVVVVSCCGDTTGLVAEYRIIAACRNIKASGRSNKEVVCTVCAATTRSVTNEGVVIAVCGALTCICTNEGVVAA